MGSGGGLGLVDDVEVSVWEGAGRRIVLVEVDEAEQFNPLRAHISHRQGHLARESLFHVQVVVVDVGRAQPLVYRPGVGGGTETSEDGNAVLDRGRNR